MRNMVNGNAEMKADKTYKYFAFISYSSQDACWGKRLQRKLEGYSLSATLCRQHGWNRKPMKPVFFAPTDIQPGALTEELQSRLRDSLNLIVICSPASAQSKWVGAEIAYFHSLGRTEHIHFFIVDGIPHSGNPASECFNPVIRQLDIPEILGANVHEKNYRWGWLNRERAYVQLITKLLGIEFDAIWQRHRRRLIGRTLVWALGCLCVMAALGLVWGMNQPRDISVRICEVSAPNAYLPPLENAVVVMTFENETKTDTIESLAGVACFMNVPARFLGQEVGVSVRCKDYMEVDTMLPLCEEICIGVHRDPHVYGDVCFRLWDSQREEFVSDCEMRVAGVSVVSDEKGCISMFIPLERQRQSYSLSAEVPLHDSVVYVPCGKSDVIVVQ